MSETRQESTMDNTCAATEGRNAEKKQKPEPSVIEAEIKSSFAFAQCNLLHSSPYKRYNKHACMSESDRSARLLNSLQQGGPFYKADILSFQEWALDKDAASLVFREQVRKLYKVEEYSQTSSFGCSVCVNPSRFTVVQTHPAAFRCKSGNGFLCVILQPMAEAKPSLGIVSMHLPFGKEGEAITEVATFIKQHPLADQVSWVVGGDCNSNKGKMMVNAFGQQGIVLHSSNPHSAPTHRSGSDKHEEYDFIFHSASLSPSPLTITPSSFDNLLSHTAPQQFTDTTFFSDHAALSLVFSPTIASKAT